MSFTTANPLKVAVIKGGTSLEREVSLESGKSVADALRSAGHQVVEIDLTQQTLPLIAQDTDCIFPVLHGTFGEDGQIQLLMQKANLAYVGCDAKCSEILMSKIKTAQVALLNNILMPKGCTLTELSKIPNGFSLPLIVKPANQGSSIGLSIVKEPEQWNDALSKALAVDHEVIIQEFIKGTEIAIGVINGEALPIVEILPPGEIFDYDAKYTHSQGETIYNCPAKHLSTAICQQAMKLAEECFRIFNCRDLARMDFIIKNDQIYFIEGNTLPGFTASSLVPKSARTKGISFAALCDCLLQSAFQRKK
ncbi:MAG: D-alanine--D-alanine ligase family protein [Lentisphaeria bacterium]